MPFVLLFLFVLATAFGLVMLLTKPSKEEVAFQMRIANLRREANLTGTSSIDILRQENYSDLPWINSLMSRLALASRIRKFITQSGTNWTVGRLVSASLLGPVLVFLLGQFVGANFILLLLVSTVLSPLPVVYLYYKRNARMRRFNMLLPEAMDLIARALKAGHSITAAIEIVAQEIANPVGQEFRRLFEEQNFGLPMREALLNLVDRVPVNDLRFLVTAILIQRDTGGNLVEVLDKGTVVLRERIRLQGQLRVYTAQGRLTGWILCLLPFLAFGVLTLVNHQYVSVLMSEPLGQRLVWTGLTLMAFGVWVIRKIIDVKV